MKKERFYSSKTELKNVSEKMLEKISKYISKDIKKSDKVLDVLTGYANFLIKIVKLKKIKIIGIDNSDFILNITRKKIKKEDLDGLIELKKADARNLPFSNNYFDVAINYGGWSDVVLTCRKVWVKQIIREMIRVLKPCGKIVISFPYVEIKNKKDEIDEKIQIYLYSKKRYFSKKYFMNELQRNKIKIIDYKIFYFPKKRIGLNLFKQLFKNHQKEVKKEFGVESKSYDQILKKFGTFIEKNGFGGVGKGIIVLVGKKMK